ncbi:MFS transporter [Serratia nevei]|nr:MFS transporter [Serratia marcescens]
MRVTGYNSQLFPLYLMAIGTFAIGTDTFIVAGVLSDISDTFAVSIAQAGQLISVFALAYMLFAPLTAWLLGNINRKRILQLALVLFIAGNLACACATNYLQVSVGRALAALGGGLLHAAGRRRRGGVGGGKTTRSGHFHRLWGHDVGYCARHSIRYLSRQTDRLA